MIRDAQQTTPQLFACLLQARGARRQQCVRALVTLGEPQVLREVALAAYAQYGNADRLTQAAAVLWEMHADAEARACLVPLEEEG